MNVFKALANVVALPVAVVVDAVALPVDAAEGKITPRTKQVLKNLGDS